MKHQNRPRLNRIYLLTGILAAFCVPFMQFSFFQASTSAIIVLPEIAAGVNSGLSYSFATDNNTGNAITLMQILSAIYILGLMIYVFITLYPLAGVLQIINRSQKAKKDGYTLVFAESKAKFPFTFFNFIILPSKSEEECNPLIIMHEKAHVELKHHYDLILMFIFGAVFWFLPFAKWYQNQLKALHEYEADSMVLEQADKQHYANCLLEQAFDVNAFSFFSHFSKPNILSR